MGGVRGTVGEDRGVRVNGGGGRRLVIAPRAFPRQDFRAGGVFRGWDAVPFGDEGGFVEGVGVRVSGLGNRSPTGKMRLSLDQKIVRFEVKGA